MKKVIITLAVALTLAAIANADLIKLELPEVTSQQIQEENAFIRAEGLEAWKAENEAKIAEQGKIDDMYFEILISTGCLKKPIFLPNSVGHATTPVIQNTKRAL